MSQEIELKFIVHQDALASLRAALNALEGEPENARNLLNIYYETPDLQLRRHDMGLRVRGDDGRYEMTMKTAGQTIGGLHQRPEYNVALECPEPELALFPAQMWPQGLNVDELSTALVPLFRTDFRREKWVVTYGESRIEIALDHGDIVAGGHQEPLCELELELLEGRVEDILRLAREKLLREGLRQGSLSKAARGYHLARGNVLREMRELSGMAWLPKATLEQGLEAALAMALSHWQYHEELWARGNTAAARQVAYSVALVRHTLALFGGAIPRKASTHLRAGLSQLEEALAVQPLDESLPWSLNSSSAQLALTEWLATRGWRPWLDVKMRSKLEGSFKRFADTHFSRLAAELKTAFSRSGSEQAGEQLSRLERCLDMARILAAGYREARWRPWLESWQALANAIPHGREGDIEHARRQALAQTPFWNHSGQH
ncbi:CYTH domain-containing protein [Erwinia sp. CPCC 100877]|nr:CYTH domain-containing protein [Erwinia sp. CPCC 100877]